MSSTTPNEKTPIVSTKTPGSLALQVLNDEPDDFSLHNPFDETIDQKFWEEVLCVLCFPFQLENHQMKECAFVNSALKIQCHVKIHSYRLLFSRFCLLGLLLILKHITKQKQTQKVDIK